MKKSEVINFEVTLIFIAVLFLAGCELVPNETIILEKDKCLRAGMEYYIGDLGRVQCIHPK